MNAREWIFISFIGSLTLSVMITLGFGMCALYVKYSAWHTMVIAETEVRSAEWQKQRVIKEAESKADSQIEMARGVAGANKIIKEDVKGPIGLMANLFKLLLK